MEGSNVASFMSDRIAFFTAGRREWLPGRLKFWDRAALKNRAGILHMSPGGRGRGAAGDDRRSLSKPSYGRVRI